MPENGVPSVEELIRRCLDSSFESEDEVGNTRSWASWESLWTLHKHPSDEVLKSVKCLLLSHDPWHRARGADILGQFEFASKAIRFDALSAALEVENDERTLTSLIYSISHLDDQRILGKFFSLIVHPNREVRRAVAMSIDPKWGDAAVTALCTLSSDDWGGVRDWATFKFRISDVDSTEIRQFLRARLRDPEFQIRAEAICALAHRRDPACLKQLVDDLRNMDILEDYSCHIEVAHELIGCGPDDERPPEDLCAELLRVYPLSLT